MEVCNTTTIAVDINGHSVSVTASKGATASSVAVNLAGKISTHPTLSQTLFATASGNTVTVAARNGGLEFAYPWKASTTHVGDYFTEPAFWPMLAPISTLVPRSSQ